MTTAILAAVFSLILLSQTKMPTEKEFINLIRTEGVAKAVELEKAIELFKLNMVQVQSTWFPVIDRNPQKFVDIYHAKDTDFQKAVHRVYHSKESPSNLKILVMKNGAS